MKKKGLTYYKKRAWKMFSTYIRTRDSLKTTGSTDKCVCITCNKRKEFRRIQAGHAIGGRNNSILFDEELVNGNAMGVTDSEMESTLNTHFGSLRIMG